MSRPGARPADERHASAPAQPTGDPRPATTQSKGGQSRGGQSKARPQPGGQDRSVSGTSEQPPTAPAGAAGEGVDSVGGGGDESVAEPSWGGWERLILVFGVVMSVLAAFVTGVVELLLTTLRAGDFVSVFKGDPIGSGGGPLIGLSVLLAIVGNLGIAWFAVTTTGRRWALGPPWALWTLLMLFASGVRTPEGDYLLSGTNYVALAMILIGSLAYAIYTYRLILKRIPPAGPTPTGKSN
jgi:hypothetical protein